MAAVAVCLTTLRGVRDLVTYRTRELREGLGAPLFAPVVGVVQLSLQTTINTHPISPSGRVGRFCIASRRRFGGRGSWPCYPPVPTTPHHAGSLWPDCACRSRA